jgi:GcrA cell cycle regulator
MLRWTRELDIVLRDTIVAGRAWQDIAASLHLSRDQVARRASRLGLKRGMSFKDAARRVRIWDKRREDRSTFHVHRREIKKPAATKPIAPNWVFRVERSKTYEIPRAKHNVTFLELESHHCRYPIGDPKTNEFCFCGAPRLDGKPYCMRCLEIASRQKTYETL